MNAANIDSAIAELFAALDRACGETAPVDRLDGCIAALRATDLLLGVMPEEVRTRPVIVEGLICGVAEVVARLLREGSPPLLPRTRVESG